MISPGCATRTFAAGSTTMGGSVLRPSIRPCSESTLPWLDGRPKSSGPCAGTSGDPDTGWGASPAVSLGCSLTGACSTEAAEQWEPDEPRGSRPVVCPAKAGMFSRRQTCRGKSQNPVVWIAEVMETETLKPIDKVSLGEATSHRAVTKVNALWLRK